MEKTVGINKKRSAAVFGRLLNNPKNYIFLRKSKYLNNRIPPWVARPQQEEIDELEAQLAGKIALLRTMVPR